MPEYVYALHDFLPENEDELSFKAGERIEVIEKDDLYQDGWWQGKNLEGVLGLFPQSYTAASHNGMVSGTEQPSGAVPAQEAEDSHVMKATLTDVQKAIEQLGGHNDQDASRSFSFASSHGDTTDKEIDTEDEGLIDPEDWHRGARKLLAQNAQREMEKRRSQEERQPIPIEDILSDESEPEDGDDYHHTRRFSPLTHKLQGSIDTIPGGSLASQPVQEEPHAEEQANGDSAPRPSKSPASSIRQARAVSPARPGSKPSSKPNTPSSHLFPLPSSPAKELFDPQSPTVRSHPDIVVPTPKTATSFHRHSGQPEAPSTPMRVPLPQSPAPVVLSDPPARSTPPPITVKSEPTPTPVVTSALAPESSKPSKTNTAEWSVEQVVDWLKSKGFDNSICDKFIEHEISGDVLLEIDNQTLKDEMGIAAFGKRKKLELAIVELRRPASLSSGASVRYTGHPSSGPPPSHSHQASVSTAISLNSPLSSGFAPHGASVTSVETPPYTAETTMTPASSEFASYTISDKKSRAGTLVPSPSDSLLRKRSGERSPNQIPEESEFGGEERDVISEGEADAPYSANSKSRRRRMFGKSFDSMSSKGTSRDSRDYGASQPTSPYTTTSTNNKRSSYEDKYKSGKGQDRLSFFSGTLGKTRKPAPRLSNGTPTPQNGDDTEKHSHTGLGRLIPSHTVKKGSTRPGTAQGIETRNASGASSFSTAVLKKRTSGPGERLVDKPTPSLPDPAPGDLIPEKSILEQIGKADFSGWLRKKGERYNSWKLRYLVLKGPHLYYLRTDNRTETKIKGYINIRGYKVLADENVNPGRYGFRIIHEQERPHYFSSEEQHMVREWMKALMKATIGRDYTKPVISSCNIPTIPLMVAQTMNPAPRPPSPTARDATQRALRRENPNQLSTRDAQVLMGLGTESNSAYLPERANVDDLHTRSNGSGSQTPRNQTAPVRPSRNTRTSTSSLQHVPDHDLVEWANRHLPYQLRFNQDSDVEISYGLRLLRIAEDIKGRPCEPPISDEAFPTNANDERLDGLFRLFDMLLDENVKMGTVSINDVRQGRPDKIVQLLKALKAWEDKREAVGRSIVGSGTVTAGGYMANIGSNMSMF